MCDCIWCICLCACVVCGVCIHMVCVCGVCHMRFVSMVCLCGVPMCGCVCVVKVCVCVWCSLRGSPSPTYLISRQSKLYSCLPTHRHTVPRLRPRACSCDCPIPGWNTARGTRLGAHRTRRPGRPARVQGKKCKAVVHRPLWERPESHEN